MIFQPRRSLIKEISIFFLVLILAMFGCTDVKENKSAKIDSLISAYNNCGRFHGTVLVAENGKIILEKGYGIASREWDMPHEPDTKFRIASITKPFVALLVMQLVEKGKIDLDGKLTDYLSFYRRDTGEKVTIHHLLSHSSGIPDYLRIPGFWQNQLLLQYSRKNFVNQFCSSDLEFKPGLKYQYNNSGYYLLGLVIEEVTGKSFETVLRENILKALGMNNTGLTNDRSVFKKKAIGYVKSGFDFYNVPYYNVENSYTSGQMFSTVRDLYLFDQALYTDLLLSAEYRKKLFTPYFHYTKRNFFIGYDWELGKLPLTDDTDSVSYVQHMGGSNGFNTLFCRFPDNKHLIVLLGNLDSAPLIEIRGKITSVLYDKPYDMPLKSIAWEMRKIIEEEGITSAIRFYHSRKAQHSDEYDLGLGELNTVGYYLLRKSRINEAITIFKLNVEIYPDYANGWDSLAEASMVNGDISSAINYYQKCLELNPGSQNAVNMLKKLNE